MVKHNQTIRRQQPTNYLSVFDRFVELALKGLNEKGHIFFKNKDIAFTFIKYFGSIVESLDLHICTEVSKFVPAYASDNSIDKIFIKFANYPSIRTIKQNLNITRTFSFQSASVNDVKQVIKHLNSNKSVGGDMQTNILKECEFTFSVVTDCINKSFEISTFPDCSKEANVTPIFKKMILLIRRTTAQLV